MRSSNELSILKLMQSLQDQPALKALRQIENSSIMKAFLDIENSPMVRAIRDIENSPVMKAIRDIENSPMTRAVQDFENSLIRAFRDIENSPIMKGLKVIEDSPTIKALLAMANRLSSVYSDQFLSIRAFEEICKKYEFALQTKVDDPFDSVATEIEEKAKRPSEGPFSAEFILNLIIVFLLFYFSQTSTNISEQRIIKRIESMEHAFAHQLAELRAYQDTDTFYVVVRSVNLRIKSNRKSRSIALLYPGLRVRLIERDSKWIKIEYFDYIEEVYRSGWVYKKYLKIMNAKAPVD